MKPIYLEFSGVNSFSERVSIDFKKLLAGGLFGIFGDTGSGKSTILDCIHLALYGEIGRSSAQECINYNCDRYEIIFEFELLLNGDRKTYRVERVRKKKNNTTEASLFEREPSGKLLALAEGTRDVSAKLLEIVGLSYDDFKMCIALPQGDFAKLVHAKPAERVELVSRLFNLERYGGALTAKINARLKEATTEETVLLTKLESLGECDEEKLEEVKALLLEKKAEEEEADKRLKKAQKSLDLLVKAREKKAEYDRLTSLLAVDEGSRAYYEQKKALLEKYPTAKSVAEKALALSQAKVRREKADEEAKRATLALQEARNSLLEAESRLKEGNFDEKLTEVEVLLSKAVSAEADKAALKKAEQDLEECIARYKKKRLETVDEGFEQKLKDLDEKLLALGKDETLTEFLENNFKGVLLSKEFGEVRKDVRALAEKYPEISEDAEVLIEKYTPVKAGDGLSFDIASAKLRFDELEKKRKALKEERSAVEKRALLYAENLGRLKLLEEEGKLYRQAVERAKAALSQRGVEDAALLERKKQALKTEKATAETSLNLARERLTKESANLSAAQAVFTETTDGESRAKEELSTILKESGFVNANEASCLMEKVGDFEREKRENEEFFTRYNARRESVKSFDKDSFALFDAEKEFAAKEEVKLLDIKKKELNGEIGGLQKTLFDLEKNAAAATAIKKELKEKSAKKEVLEKLSKLTRGNAFMNFIASEYLEDVSRAASVTLLGLTGGRYFLSYENKEFLVGDNLNGGEKRAVRTLSGGETFLVSLSLALSLSAAICQSVRHIEFFFLDEGFGTLDGKLVDMVMDVLGRLSKEFSIGLISHVEELKSRIQHKIIVDGATESKGSSLRLETH